MGELGRTCWAAIANWPVVRITLFDPKSFLKIKYENRQKSILKPCRPNLFLLLI